MASTQEERLLSPERIREILGLLPNAEIHYFEDCEKLYAAGVADTEAQYKVLVAHISSPDHAKCTPLTEILRQLGEPHG